MTTEEEEEELPYLIFAKRVALHRINLDGTELDTIIANSSLASNAIAIDFDARYCHHLLCVLVTSQTAACSTSLDLTYSQTSDSVCMSLYNEF